MVFILASCSNPEKEHKAMIKDMQQNNPVYKELNEVKWWEFINAEFPPFDSMFRDQSWKDISISFGSVEDYNTTDAFIKINNSEFTAVSDCEEWQEVQEDSYWKICTKSLYKYSFNGEAIEEKDNLWSMGNIYISKKWSHLAAYDGKLIVNFDNNTYEIFEDNSNFNKEDYITYFEE